MFGFTRWPRCVTIWLLMAGLLSGCSDQTQIQKNAQTAQSQPAEVQPIVRTTERGPLKVTVKADRDRVQIPQQVQLTIRIEAEAGVEVGVPKLEGLIGEFGIAGVKESEPDCGDLARCKMWTYQLDSFVAGQQQIPALTFSFRDPREKADGSKEVYKDTLTTAPIDITVTQSLADIKDPVTLPMPFRYVLLWWAIGAVVVMVLIGLAVRWWRKRGAVSTTPVAVELPPHVWALHELDKLIAEDLIGRGLIQEFYYRINGLLRRYIERRFGLMAGEQTSEEFIRALQHSEDLMADSKTMLHQFVVACDPVKYARHQPGLDEIEWVQTSARDFVLQTAAEAEEGNHHPEKIGARQGVAV